MVRALTVIAMAGILFWAMPAQAEMALMANSDLDAISGKAHIATKIGVGTTLGSHTPNTFEIAGTSTTTQTVSGDSNIQVGWFQWSDDHTMDASDHKGANNQSGVSSAVQQNVTAELNAISWGAYAGNTQLAGDISGAAIQKSLARSSLRIGGF